MKYEVGTVTAYLREIDYGRLRSESGEELDFHISQVWKTDRRLIRIGSHVQYKTNPDSRGPVLAQSIRLVSEVQQEDSEEVSVPA